MTVSAQEAPPAKARVLVVDDHPFLREGVRGFLNRQPDLTACGEAADIPGAWAQVESLEPDLVLLDFSLGTGDVLEFIKSLKARFPALHVLVLSMQEEAIYAERALRAGAGGYVTKQESPDEVAAAIRMVLKGELYVTRKLASSLLGKLLQHRQTAVPRQVDGLSDREFQVLQMIGIGQGNREIAQRLGLSVKTVETYRENIKHKVGLRNSAELIHYATNWLQTGSVATLKTPSALPQAVPVPALVP